jgi:pSer/pThr/pTyr-binding forkhead associated (FHA) protein
MAAKLLISKNNQEINQIHLERTVLTIGRKHVNDLHLDDLSVSGTHAKILTVGNDSFIEDMNSTNGTFLNGERVQKSPLKDKDTLKIGEYELRYLNDVSSVDDDMEKTVIIQAGAVTMQDPEASKPAAPAASAPTPSTSAAAPASTEGAKLTVVAGPSKGKSLSLSKLLTRVKGPNGQSSVISKKDDGYYLLNTLAENLAPNINGVVVGVGSTKLNDGDVIAMGDNQLRFTSS